jgi:ribosomal protein S18 acetylase RimI-like enzyme
MREIAKEHKGVSLFVKQENAPAISTYEKVGFSIEDDFRISYYRN